MKMIANVALAIGVLACGAAHPAVASDVSLIHDIPGNHPRIPYFAAMVDEVARQSGGAITIAINPGGRIYPGKASLDAVRDGGANLTWVNTSHLETLDPRLGVVNLPFSLDDTSMASSSALAAVVETLDAMVRPHGLRLLGLMRGADQLFIFEERQPSVPADLKDVRVRVAGRGIYTDIMKSLGVEPVAMPITEIKDAFARGAVEGVFTSPGGWASQIDLDAPYGTRVPGLMFITYSLVANKAWFDGLPEEQQRALANAAEKSVTLQWDAMRVDDENVIGGLRSRGARFKEIEALEPWRQSVEPVVSEFRNSFPDVFDDFVRARQASDE